MSNGSRGAEWQHPGSPSSATDYGGQGRQVHFLDPLTLIQFVGSSEAFSGNVDFRVEVPDSRLRVNLAIIGVPLQGASPSFIGTKGLKLWLRAVEDAVQGGANVPITNLWGKNGTGDPIPGFIDNTGTAVADTSLGGWALEAVTAGNAIVGTINYPAIVNTGPGNLMLQVRYTPEAIRFPRDEWREICSQCSRSVLGLTLLGAG